jgi:serine protease
VAQEKELKRKNLKEIVGYSPRVVVKFHDYVSLPYHDEADQYIEELQVGPWKRLAKEFRGITLRPLYTSLKEEEIRALVDRATELDPTYRPPNLLTYFVVNCPPRVKPEQVAEVLSSWETVQTAYVDPPGEEPIVDASDDPRSPNQGYLDPAPDGIDARFVWPKPDGTGIDGGDGAGQRVVDLERGWTFDHEDLTDHGASLLHGAIRDDSRAHGTSVLGELCAVDNAIGNVGIASALASVDATSYWGSNRPDALLAAIAAMEFGDVLLLEAQLSIAGWSMMPIEVLDAEFDTIRLATALGIVVVEAAGNGSNDLDTYTNGAGDAIFNRTAAGFRDSGAIMVGAATSTAPHARITIATHGWGPNFGSRVDCYAWGENVDTCSSNSAGATDLYRSTFNGTSSASPIVTGAALLVQGIAEANLGYRFSPRQMRTILSDPTTGTASQNPAFDRIGVMPNLQQIVQSNVLNLAPDVYIRDHVGDNGDPHAGAISASPDIILLPDPVPDPQAAFGEGSGTENSSTLGYEAEAGQDNVLYARVRNRGGSAAANVDATIFWSPVATLLTPDLWTPVGATTIPNVPNGDLLTVSDAITWLEDDIPGPGHYCFVGLVGNAQDPAPDPADFLDWDNYRRFIRENNNVTWRNFNVVDNVPDPEAGDPEGYVALAFLAPGAPDKARRMRLEVFARLPKGAKIWLEMPLRLRDALQEISPFAKVIAKYDVARMPVNPHGRKAFKEMVFPAKSRTKMRLLVHIPEEYRRNEYQVWVRQLYREEEVGRVTWRLAPRKDKEQRPKRWPEEAKAE